MLTLLRSKVSLKKEKEMCDSFAVPPQTAKVMATVHAKCFIKMEKALNLYNEIFSQSKRDHITFITVYCYNCSIIY